MIASLKARLLTACLSALCTLPAHAQSGPQDVLIVDVCAKAKTAHAAGVLTSDASLALRVLTTPEASRMDGCLRAQTSRGQVYSLRQLRSSMEGGLALFAAESSTERALLPATSARLSLGDLEILSRQSDSHLIPWLDRGWDVLLNSKSAPLPGTGVFDQSGHLSGLISTQWLNVGNSSRALVIPVEYVSQWLGLLNAGKIPENGASLSSSWMREALPLPQGFKPGLQLDPRLASGGDPMGVNGELIAAADRSPHGARAQELLKLIESKQTLGLFLERGGVWFQTHPRTYVELAKILSEEGDLIAPLRGRTNKAELKAIEIEALRSVKRLRDARLQDLAYLAEQVRILAVLAQDEDSFTAMPQALANVSPASSVRWKPFWSHLSSRLPDEANQLTNLLQRIEQNVGARP